MNTPHAPSLPAPGPGAPRPAPAAPTVTAAQPRRAGLAAGGLLLATAVALPAQQAGDEDAVATFLLDGGRATVGAEDLALTLAERYRGTERGDAAIRQLIDLEVVHLEAEAAGIRVDRRAAEQRLQTISDQLAAQGSSLAEFLDQRGMTRAELLDYCGRSLAHERLARRALEMDPDDPLEPEMLELWLDEARRRQHVVTDAEALPAGVVARVGERDITLLRLGRLLAGTSDAKLQQRFIRQIVWRRLLAARAKALDISVTPAEAAAEVAARRALAESDPSFGGVPFEQILETQGSSPEELARSPVLTGQVLERKLARIRYPDDELRRELAERRDEVLQRVGPRRRLRMILQRASETPNELVPRSFDEARTRIAELRERILGGHPFERLARVHSDDPYSKVRGGDIGWHRPTSPVLPEDVAAWAFTAEAGDVSLPLRSRDGYLLVAVDEIEAMPDDAMLLERLRQESAQRLRYELLAEADIEFSLPGR